VTDLTGSMAASSRILDAAIPGFADAWPLPDAGLFSDRAPVVLPAGVKEGLLRTVGVGARLRRAVRVPALPLPSRGALLLTGPGTRRQGRPGQRLVPCQRASRSPGQGAVTARGPLVRLRVPGLSLHALAVVAACRVTCAPSRAEPKGAGYLCVR
jgi:hypothetical protein